jgi:NAD(P)-dependent dehydrogenase (short-subunit alcohol dehydrogenase family)
MTDQPALFRLDGKAGIVTGAGRGLGRAIAIEMARAGARLVLVARSVSELAETVSIIRSEGGEAAALPLDVTEDGSAERAIQAALDRFGRHDLLVMSAGTAVTRSATEMPMADWDKVIAVNLRAPFAWSQASGRTFVSNGGGRIIHISSIAGAVGVAKLAAYCASKGGLNALTRALAVEWAHAGVTVNAIAPGYVPTALNAGALASERFSNHLLQRIPMARLGTPEEIAAVAVFLASDQASYITGHVLATDGGWLAS